ncbi:RagB/SusD family nutrient uptake outer membrane protein [Pedobacter sp. MC2016-14]|uniref:RagB/SusD family nutrient uptake outer membrane protein n=1 Tax=Pedobacter sp. MC2016-14 TaxID=2897327 RepID=UPI001E4A6745|nr:RagB/SusD family nutrient uptake outer membrane protein [Pedobacter sp. MC2016-14]MCD0490408.1 RagB/SusD family nutrient uptake outer membrane protein [Pedobacter sp. MC2016-14]
MLSSCKKWLDVEPNSQIKSSELFKTESGFKEALAGVYTLMIAENLYGKEQQYGMLAVLSHEWSSFPEGYNGEAEYNYESSTVQGRMSSIWNGLYQAISNTNNLLVEIDSKKSIFSGDNYSIIKGEALALRAFLHFELVRLFGASYMVDMNKPAIPYVTQYSANQTKQSTVKETYEFIRKDLEAAKELLRTDPILTGRTITQADDNGYLINRQLHLNYYAVEALLARMFYYTGEYEKARTAATTVINSGKFTYSLQSNLGIGNDLSGAPEHIFGLHINNMYTYSTEYLSKDANIIYTFYLNSATHDAYYPDKSIDYRYIYLFEVGEGVKASNYYSRKYSAPVSQELYYRNKSVVIKISEMQFIIAGSNLAEGKSIIAPINKVRQARGLQALTIEPPDPTATYIEEFRKEFFAEGQLFYLYKRLNRTTITGTDKNLVDIKAYIWPLPVAELEAGNRTNNR